VVDADDAGNGGVVVAGSGATGDADSETDDPLKAEIMRATYRALIEQGYSELTIQGIADEFPKKQVPTLLPLRRKRRPDRVLPRVRYRSIPT